MRRLLLALLFATAPMAALPATGSAEGPDVAVGTAAFTGEGRMPVVPCRVPVPGHPMCEGTWQGTFTGAFEGVHVANDGRRIPWMAELDVPGTVHVGYADPSSVESVCDEAVVNGRASFSGGPGQVFGAYAHGSPLPSAIVGLTLSLGFEWQQQAGTGTVLLTRLRIDLDVLHNGRITVVDSAESITVSDAVATLVPDDPATCAKDAPTALDGVVAGKLSGIAVRAN